MATYVLLPSIRPVQWAKAFSAEDRARLKTEIDSWFRELDRRGAQQILFTSWKKARTVICTDGDASDIPGPLLVGRPNEADAVVVAVITVDAKSMSEAVAIARSWPVPEAFVEVRPV